MKRKFVRQSTFAAIVASRGSAYSAAVETAIIERTAEGVWLDADHPGWSRATKLRARDKVDPSNWGTQLWADLHRWANETELSVRAINHWLGAFANRVKCGDCRNHWRQLVKANPPPTGDRDKLQAWTYQRHHDVNIRIGKPTRLWQDAAKQWGWPVYPEGAVHVWENSTGLGDAVCGLYAVCGLADVIAKPVVFHAHSSRFINRASHPGVTIIETSQHKQGVDLSGGARGYNLQIAKSETRVSHYCETLAVHFRIPAFEPRRPANIDTSVKSENPSGNYIVLSPFSAFSSREWPGNKWAELSRRIKTAGYLPVVVDSDGQRAPSVFAGTPAIWVYGRTPSGVDDLLLGAKLVVGNDSGIVHLAGLLGVPAVAVHAGSMPHDFLFRLSPTVTSVTAGGDLPRSDHNTTALRGIAVDAVEAAILLCAASHV